MSLDIIYVNNLQTDEESRYDNWKSVGGAHCKIYRNPETGTFPILRVEFRLNSGSADDYVAVVEVPSRGFSVDGDMKWLEFDKSWMKILYFDVNSFDEKNGLPEDELEVVMYTFDPHDCYFE